MFDLHLSLGVSRWTFLAGKWIGLYACLLIAVAPGMLLEGRAFLAAGGDAGTFAALLLYCALLASAITSTGLLISSCSLNRGTVVSLAVGSWIVLLDLVVVGMLAATAGTAAADFVAQHGGTLYRFDEIDTALIKQVRRQGIEHLAGH